MAALSDFCTAYIKPAKSLLEAAPVFIWFALGLATLFALVELRARWINPPNQRDANLGDEAKSLAVSDLIKALIDLIAGLASAPIWLAVFALGIALYWFVGFGWGAAGCP